MSFAAVLFLLGLILGSFGNVLLCRVPRGESIGGRSRCPSCAKTIAVHELIPVLSFLFLRGRCSGCRARISLRYPLVELASGLLFLLALLRERGEILPSLFLGLSLWMLLLIAITDAGSGLIPDTFNIPFALFSLLYVLAAHSFGLSGLLLALGFLGAQWVVSRGRWIGSGDLLLAVGIGLLLGTWERALLALMAAYIAGGVIGGLLLLLRRKTRKDALPFGPFLAGGAMAVVFFGEGMTGALGIS